MFPAVVFHVPTLDLYKNNSYRLENVHAVFKLKSENTLI